MLEPLRWVAAALPLLGAALWLWWLLKTRSRLNRFEIDRNMETHDLAPPAPEAPFRDRRAQELAKEMRRRKPSAVWALAAEPTVVGTARSAGLFTPVFTASTRPREFLWLVDRAGAGDQQLEFFTQLAGALRHHGAFIDLYTFRRTPEQLRDSASVGWIDLKEAAARHPEHDVWVLADPAELLRGAQEQAPEWIRDLGRWQDAAILSTSPVHPSARSLLEAEGVRTGRATLEGMIAMIQGEAKGAGTGAPYPRPLRLIPRRWVENTPQDEREEEAMMAQARAYLGSDGMLLAGACSIYPETFWEMTLWLAQKLAPSGGSPGRMDEALARLTSLPWFRYGRIPDWMRARLIGEMGVRERSVRELVEAYLTKTEKRKGALRIAKGKRGQEAPVRDYILFSFLLGRRVDRKLAIRPPSAWLRLLFEGGRLEFGPRVWIHALGTALLCALAWTGADFAMRHVPVRLEVSTWKLPGAAERSQVTRVFPNDPMQRAMAAVAEAAVGTPVRELLRETGQNSFERAVAARAALFVTGSEKPPVARQRLTVEAGRVLNGGVVASLAGRIATVIRPEGETVQLAKVSVTNQLAVSYAASLVNPVDGLTYLWIPPGEFLMGCSPGDGECDSDEKPAHPVRITKGFWISESEVTQAAYQKVIGSNPSNFKGADLPVEDVNWNQAVAYCKAVGGRLPTEAEWEYAARAGDPRARYGELDAIAWYDKNSREMTHPVKGLMPNRFGLYDMLGNVWEWNADWYGEYQPGAQVDPKGPARGTDRVIRGGSWNINSRTLPRVVPWQGRPRQPRQRRRVSVCAGLNSVYFFPSSFCSVASRGVSREKNF
ncbi:MAG: formylglycine-generating enzyme family protein [Acidobacteria bacterium]|nr:formylglycine-generating enzyme family protein [Acidobacteriota bacterium]